ARRRVGRLSRAGGGGIVAGAAGGGAQHEESGKPGEAGHRTNLSAGVTKGGACKVARAGGGGDPGEAPGYSNRASLIRARQKLCGPSGRSHIASPAVGIIIPSTRR